MRRLSILSAIVLMAPMLPGWLAAQETPARDPAATQVYSYDDRFDQAWEEEEKALSRGGFAVLVMKVIETEPVYWYNIDPVRATAEQKVQALTEAKRLELIPQVWIADEKLMSSDLDEFLVRIGVSFVADREKDNEVSRSYAEAVLRRVASRLRDYAAKRTGHGWSSAHDWLDEGVDRAVSPIYIGRWE